MGVCDARRKNETVLGEFLVRLWHVFWSRRRITPAVLCGYAVVETGGGLA